LHYFVPHKPRFPAVLCAKRSKLPGKSNCIIPWADNALLARKLYDDYGVITRCGLHCSPLAHQCAGSFPGGSLRFSFGFETTEAEIDAALRALEDLRI
jgi:selenocysteine lyase/cysteine desulfurase